MNASNNLQIGGKALIMTTVFSHNETPMYNLSLVLKLEGR
jgi:hypothetical protein